MKISDPIGNNFLIVTGALPIVSTIVGIGEALYGLAWMVDLLWNHKLKDLTSTSKQRSKLFYEIFGVNKIIINIQNQLIVKYKQSNELLKEIISFNPVIKEKIMVNSKIIESLSFPLMTSEGNNILQLQKEQQEFSSVLSQEIVMMKEDYDKAKKEIDLLEEEIAILKENFFSNKKEVKDLKKALDLYDTYSHAKAHIIFGLVRATWIGGLFISLTLKIFDIIKMVESTDFSFLKNKVFTPVKLNANKA